MGISIIGGRDFREDDLNSSKDLCIFNRTAGDLYGISPGDIGNNLEVYFYDQVLEHTYRREQRTGKLVSLQSSDYALSSVFRRASSQYGDGSKDSHTIYLSTGGYSRPYSWPSHPSPLPPSYGRAGARQTETRSETSVRNEISQAGGEDSPSRWRLSWHRIPCFRPWCRHARPPAL